MGSGRGSRRHRRPASCQQIETGGCAQHPVEAYADCKSCFSPVLYRSPNTIRRMFCRLIEYCRISTLYAKIALNSALSDRPVGMSLLIGPKLAEDRLNQYQTPGVTPTQGSVLIAHALHHLVLDQLAYNLRLHGRWIESEARNASAAPEKNNQRPVIQAVQRHTPIDHYATPWWIPTRTDNWLHVRRSEPQPPGTVARPRRPLIRLWPNASLSDRAAPLYLSQAVPHNAFAAIALGKGV